MSFEKSCGAVVFTRDGGEIRYVIIESCTGFPGFPKGHMEGDETERETALREVLEETGLRVRLFDCFKGTEEYTLTREGRPWVRKQVVYFIAEFSGQTPVPQQGEVTRVRLLNYECAMREFWHDSKRRLLQRADACVRSSLCGREGE